MYTLDDLIYLMVRLRDPVDGCPWDVKQNYRSITPSTIEEAYEVVDAIEREDYLDLKEELGDLLFQVVFYAQLASEERRFSLPEVIDRLTAKLIRRHPHVFPAGTLASRRIPGQQVDDLAIKQSWETLKSEERRTKGKDGLMDDIPTALPAMVRAQKLQKRAAKVGFDWVDLPGVIEKLREEIQELEAAAKQDNVQQIQEEIGDLLFTCVNLARHCKTDPEIALRDANSKFYQRFQWMEAASIARGENIEGCDSKRLEELWESAKEYLASKQQY